MKTISLVVPCYNEEKTIALFYEETSRVMRLINEPEMRYQPEYIFVDDGSPDNTLKEMQSLADAHPAEVHYVSFSRNFGKEAGLAAGLQNAHGDLVAVMDVDLQDPPALLPEMIETIETEDVDCVGTIQKERVGQGWFRAFLSRNFYRVINWISAVRIEPNIRDYRLMTRRMVDAVLSMPEVNRFSKGIFAWVGFDTKYITYESQPRVAGDTHWSIRQLFEYSLEGIMDFSDAPLKVATWIGGMSFLASIIGIIIVIVQAFFGTPVSGWSSMVCIMLMVGGLQLFCLGIVGKYISKIYLESKHRPKYIVREQR